MPPPKKTETVAVVDGPKRRGRPPANKPASRAKPATSTSNGQTRGRKKKEGLRLPQIRILRALDKAKSPLSRNQIGEKAQIEISAIAQYLGSTSEARRKEMDSVCMSLLSLKFIKVDQEYQNNRQVFVYSITPAGKKALEKAS